MSAVKGVGQGRLLIGLPGLAKPEGPKIFLSRLRDSILKQRLARTTHFLNPFHDVSLFVSVARDYYGKPYVLRLDGIFIDSSETCGPNHKLNAPIRRAMEGARGLVFQSRYSRQTIEHHLGAVNVPSAVIPNGASLERFGGPGETMRPRLGIPAGARVMLTSGSWRAHKRLSAVIALFRELCRHHEDLHLIVVGPNAGDRAPHDRIHYTGFIPPAALPKWYRSADMYVFLTWLDNCPNSVVEAIVGGLPVLCTDLGGTRELVERADAGIVVAADEPVSPGLVDLYHPPAPDLGALVAAAEDMLADLPGYRARLRRDALDVDGIARDYVAHIARCVGFPGAETDG